MDPNKPKSGRISAACGFSIPTCSDRSRLLFYLLLLLFITACTSEREVQVTQIVEVTRQVPVEVIREVEVTREVPVEIPVEVEVTREVPVEIAVEVEVTRVVLVEVTSEAGQTTEQVSTNSQPTAQPAAETTVVAVTDQDQDQDQPSDTSTQTDNPPSLATTIAVAGQDTTNNNTLCWTWQEAAQHIGENGCVEGNVSGVGDTPNVFFINFSEERDSFYAIAFDWAWEELTGECLRLNGVISEYQGRAQMIIENPPTQVHYCGNNEDGPPAFER